MLGDSSVLGSAISRDATATAAMAVPEGGGGDGGGGGGGSNSGEDTFRGAGGGDDLLGSGERSFGGNRWPRQETLALLQIRSDMDVAFRDASVKGPLWDEVSRKLAALGYHRSAKKCKEKFENVYKYHRRTKEGRTGKSEGKTYRFFDQLEALENQPQTPGTTHHHQAKPHHQSTMAAVAATMASTIPSSAAPHPIISNVSSQAIAAPTLNLAAPNSFPPTNPIVLPPPPQPPPSTTTNPTNNPHHHHHNTFSSSFPNISADLSTSSSTSSDEDLEGRAKRKRKWKDFFQRLMKEVIQKQEDLQKRFLEAIEKREHEKMVREEAWRMQEMARVNRERELLAQERSIAAAKDAAVMSFLQKISEQQQNPNQTLPPGQSQINNNLLQLQPTQLVPPPPRQPAPLPQPQPQPQSQQPVTNFELVPKPNNNGENNNLSSPASSSRWPKVEVQALIKLRTSLDSKYQENGPKGPLWEEISGAMRKLGYNRSSKRCKEKWENINKYFKKVKESNKRRPEDSKTCPYFHQLDSLYRERNKFDHNNVNPKPENSVPLMVRPEQQWPPPTPQQQQQDHQNMDIDHHHHDHQNQEDDHQDKENIIGGDEDEEEEDDDDEEDEEEDEGDGNYEIVANEPAPVGAAAAE